MVWNMSKVLWQDHACDFRRQVRLHYLSNPKPDSSFLPVTLHSRDRLYYFNCCPLPAMAESVTSVSPGFWL